MLMGCMQSLQVNKVTKTGIMTFVSAKHAIFIKKIIIYRIHAKTGTFFTVKKLHFHEFFKKGNF